ncbi:hypothetical protein [Umezakia ovalisporum]|uniref:hypothetical protein n=1 Tax=Umezakia ovalisporum TaxID=75695 RepID=UPI0024750D9F|nr:hypothetical protein [Umezakia ovalisporum]MDH6086670.1 hypothetical protein [Umezakia ovalisporum TAC611]MDH6089948.1 hypothetical protein [Umezakia ovalisporum Ak1311]
MTQTLNLTGLTPEQIEQIKTIIAAFKAKNQLDQMQNLTETQITQAEEAENNLEINLNDLFFSSEILTTFNRSMLYRQRA